MPTLNLGQVRPVYRGAWNSIDTYVAYDFVIYNGSAYLALKDVPSNYEPPSQTEYWVLFGAKGEPGAPGEDGVDGAQGERGPSPAYRWDGTFLSIQNPDGTFPDQGVNLQGPAVPLSNSVTSTSETDAASSKAVKTAYDLANSKLPISGGTITGGLTINGGLESHQNINLTSDEANGLAIALYNTSNAILSSLRFKNNLITVEKGVFSADGVYSRGNMQLCTDDSNGLAIALYDLDGVSLYNAVRLKKDGTVSLEFQPLDISQGGTGARDAATARTNLFVPARPQNEEGPGQFTAIGVSAAQFTLPSGGSWAYSAIATDSSRLVSVIRSGVDAGGSTIYFGSNIAALFGFCWRWQ